MFEKSATKEKQDGKKIYKCAVGRVYDNQFVSGTDGFGKRKKAR